VRFVIGEHPLSELVSILVAAVICDTAATDPSTKKKSLIGIFDRITVARFPTSRPLSLYVRLGDASGRYEVDFRYVQVGSDRRLAGARGNLQIAQTEPSSAELIVNFPPLSIPEPGRYEFQVWANSWFLGSTYIDAVQRSE
jgi:hypothetical protein